MNSKPPRMFGESRYRNTFRENVSHEFVGDSLRLLINTYRSVWEDLKRRYPFQEAFGEAHDLFPHELRANFDYNWRKLARKHIGVTGNSLPNSTGGAYRTEIVSGKMVLTQLAVETPKSMRRFNGARFRQHLAETYQLDLFDKHHSSETSSENTEAADKKPVYGVLLHGPAQAATPGFAFIGFPKANSKGYADTINLFHYYPEMLKLYEEPVEAEQDLDIQLKPSALKNLNKGKSV